MTTLRGIYARIRVESDETTIGGRLLQQLHVQSRASNHDLDHIPRSGPTLLVLNHPTGLLEGAVLMEVLRRIRPDVRFLANRVLADVPELRNWVIPVDVMGSAAQSNVPAMRQAATYLSTGGLLVVLPAGEVSSFHLRKLAICDAQWHPSIARIIAWRIAVERISR